ncbi:SRPBCC domain-containing protein [Amycolatopsis sp. NPDC051903]|uniref:SRPBCC domain-containing protein n=1 Tax=Amycolatopsis sp. NPDC051903 TaxID=3363936 RepID=UPI0037A1CBDD
MEYGTIEREIHIDATPEVVYEVITKPEYIAAWWGFDLQVAASAGATGRMTRTRRDGSGTLVVPLSVVEAEAPRRFAFRWAHPDGQPATPDNSFLVTFHLAPSGEGTVLRLTEAGFREVGWEAARLEAYHRDHSAGWDEHLGALGAYAAGLVRA